jgi:putative addiction module component (TIGR02574 family)
MTQTHEGIASAALALPPDARIELAERLLSSLDLPEQAAIDAAWAEEVERRIDQLDRGEATVIPGDILMAKLRGRRP